MSQGRYIYLTEWGDPRRETVLKAVSTVLDNASEPLALEEIVTLVEHRVGRKCEKPTISAILRVLEVELDEGTQQWSRNLFANDDDDRREPIDTNSPSLL